MASRQNRKKKGRANQQNRERTVTTLTEDPNTPFLVPTPSEEPAGPSMSSPFSVSSSSGGAPNNNNNTNNNSIVNGGYPISGNFPYSGSYSSSSYMGPMHAANAHPPQFQPNQQLQLPAGKDDVEILEKLKEKIKSGQHDRFQAKPQPDVLLGIYQEGLQVDTYSQPNVSEYQEAGYNQTGYDVGSAISDTGPKTALPTADVSCRLPRIHTGGDAGFMFGVGGSVVSTPNIQAPLSGNHYSSGSMNVTPSPVSKQENDSRTALDPKVSTAVAAGSDAAQSHGRFGGINPNSRGHDPGDQNDQRRPPGDSPVIGEYGLTSRPSNDPSSPTKPPTYDGKNVRPGRDLAWQQRDGPATQDDKRGRPELDRSGPSFTRPIDNVAKDPDARGVGPRDQRFLERDRDRDRDRRERDWERDRDHRRTDFRRDERPRIMNTRGPSTEQRHYEPRYSSDIPRRDDSRPPANSAMEVDKRSSSPTAHPGSADDRAGRPSPTDDRPVRPPTDNRTTPRVLPSDARPARVPPVDDRRPASGDNRHVPTTDDRNPRSAPLSQSVQDSVPSRLSTDRGARAPPPPEDDRNARTPVPLEHRIRRTPPTLQERITHPPDDRPSRQPSLEERISHAPPAGIDRPIPHDDRVVRPSTADRTSRPVEPVRPTVRPDDRSARPVPPSDRYTRPVTPQDRGPRGANYSTVPPSPSAAVVRDDPRVARAPPPSPPAQDYRPVRAISRERDLRPAPRPEADRLYDPDRRTDLMDVDPPRFHESRPPFQRRLTPPPGDRAYPLPSSPPLDTDRRYPVGDRRDWQYEDGPRRWGTADDEYRRPASWDREALDRDRVERGVLPARNTGWDREERERRPSFPDSPSARPFDGSQQRPLSSRLTDGYSGPNDDRTYRERYQPLPVESRVRPRSRSPPGRRPGPGNVVDDGRPPTKRVREDAYPYYSQPSRRPPVSSGPGDYSPRGDPAPSAGGSGVYYDARTGPPPPASGGRTGGTPYDRDYPTARDRGPEVGGYVPGPATYDRPRSPPPSRLPPPLPYSGRGNNYTRPGGDSRDDRRYNSMPPPPPRNN